MLKETWHGPLPRSARDDVFADWVRDKMTGVVEASHDVAVDLRFSGPVNLGDVATGRIKNVLDCLYPVLGGSPGAPNDSVITSLEATREDAGVTGTVAIMVRLLDRPPMLRPTAAGELRLGPSSATSSLQRPALGAATDRTNITVEDAIREAFEALGGDRSIAEITRWIDERYPGRWRDISTAMADLTFPGPRSSTFPPHRRVLERVGRGPGVQLDEPAFGRGEERCEAAGREQQGEEHQDA